MSLRSYSRETPSRFKKEMLTFVESNGLVEMESLNRVLVNIGHHDRLLSNEEYQTLVREAGDVGTLSASNMMKLF